ncbi:hypothetical protein LBMAG42_02440 [Deltaproteobacteria bacterium]|nr:hypothetical protein LBMAG42_02440 [Deltaproteobacteria bacterium]
MLVLVLVACIGLQAVPGGADGGPTSIGGVAVSASAIDFGAVQVGDFAEELLVLTNDGKTGAHVVAEVTGTGFSADLTGFDLVRAGEEVITVTFEPDGEGAFAGDLSLAVGEETISVPLSGSGEVGGGDTDTGGSGSGGELTTDQPSLAFGNLDLYASSMMQVTVSNTGTGPLTIDSATTTDSAFTLGGNLTPPRTLDPGDERVVEVTFTPTAEKTYSANLELVSDDANAAKTKIALSGKGENLCDICSPLITVDTGSSSDYAIDDFFSISSLHTEDARTVTVGNDGDQDLDISDIVVNNDYIATAGTFKLSGSHGASTVAPGRTITFTITFSANDSCIEAPLRELDTNLVHIYSNDPVESDYVIELSGIGL